MGQGIATNSNNKGDLHDPSIFVYLDHVTKEWWAWFLMDVSLNIQPVALQPFGSQWCGKTTIKLINGLLQALPIFMGNYHPQLKKWFPICYIQPI